MEHSVPKEKENKGVRVNVTIRVIKKHQGKCPANDKSILLRAVQDECPEEDQNESAGVMETLLNK